MAGTIFVLTILLCVVFMIIKSMLKKKLEAKKQAKEQAADAVVPVAVAAVIKFYIGKNFYSSLILNSMLVYTNVSIKKIME